MASSPLKNARRETPAGVLLLLSSASWREERSGEGTSDVDGAMETGAAAGILAGHERRRSGSAARLLRPARFAAAGSRVRRVPRGALRTVLRRRDRPARHSARRLFPHAVPGLLRRARLAAGDRLAVRRQPLAAGVSRLRPERTDARPFVAVARPRPPAARSARAGLRLHDLDRREEEASEREGGGRRFDDARGRRGDEDHRPQGHRRRLEEVPQAADAGTGPDPGRGRAVERRAAAVRPQPQRQESLERGVEVADRRRRPHRSR